MFLCCFNSPDETVEKVTTDTFMSSPPVCVVPSVLSCDRALELLEGSKHSMWFYMGIS